MGPRQRISSRMRARKSISEGLLAVFLAALRGAHEHLDEIIMQTIVELPLEVPLELWMVQIARVQFEVVRVHRKIGIAELDNDLYPFAFDTGVEYKQRVLVEPELLQDKGQAAIGCRFGHAKDCTPRFFCAFPQSRAESVTHGN